jgi:adenosylcobyric acid synthase
METGRADGYYLNDKTWGTYIHGIFDNASVIERVLRQIDPKFPPP